MQLKFRKKSSDPLLDILSRYVKGGDKVAELYHGEKEDILFKLSRIVGDSGKIYGIDGLNPFDNHENMRKLQEVPNIELLESSIPPLPDEALELDSIVIRGFSWMGYYECFPFFVPNPKNYPCINSAIKPGGHLIVVEHTDEQHHYNEEVVRKYMPNFSRKYRKKEFMVFRKDKDD
jgi:hypothetical protein